jgi:hypothetical protein
MLALGLVLNTLGIGLFCWAIFALAVYALPFFVALSIGMTALQSGAGVVGALLIGTAGGALTHVLGQIAVAVTQSLTLRTAVATAFAVPAAVAGHHLVYALSQIGMPSPGWREAFACLGAACVAGTAWTRLTVSRRPARSSRLGRWRSRPNQFLRPPRGRDDRSPPSSPNRLAVDRRV